MQKRGQAAMEFLMTYGWAILAAVVVIGVLAYFGVFNPSKLVPNSCTLSNPLGCQESMINSSGVHIVIRNGLGETVIISNISVSNCNEASIGSLADGVNRQVSLLCAKEAGQTFKGEINVVWQKMGGTFNSTSTGSVTGRVQ